MDLSTLKNKSNLFFKVAHKTEITQQVKEENFESTRSNIRVFIKKIAPRTSFLNRFSSYERNINNIEEKQKVNFEEKNVNIVKKENKLNSFFKKEHKSLRSTENIVEELFKKIKPRSSFLYKYKDNEVKEIYAEENQTSITKTHAKSSDVDINTVNKEMKTNVNFQEVYKTEKVTETKEEILEFTQNVIQEKGLFKKIKPQISFPYRDKTKTQTMAGDPSTSYTPMNIGNKYKSSLNRFSKQYPFLNYNKFKFNKIETNDRCYYITADNSKKDQKLYENQAIDDNIFSSENVKTDGLKEENFYEDLNFNDRKVINLENTLKKPRAIVKKYHETISSTFKMPNFKQQKFWKLSRYKNNKDRGEEIKEIKEKNPNEVAEDCPGIDCIAEHLYCELDADKEYGRESLMVGIQSENCNKDIIDSSDKEINNVQFTDYRQPSFSKSNMAVHPPSFSKSNMATRPSSSNMATRPLPVPIDNEPYYMNLNREEAENLLKGHPDGTFILRPSSQPNHAYTISVCCAGAVHNIGVRRRDDSKLAIGFGRKSERSFPTIQSLLHYHNETRLEILSEKSVIGATCLKEPLLSYYQIPSSLPVSFESQIPSYQVPNSLPVKFDPQVPSYEVPTSLPVKVDLQMMSHQNPSGSSKVETQTPSSYQVPNSLPVRFEP